MRRMVLSVLTGLGAAFVILVMATALFAQSPGDTVGWTQVAYQTNGSTGNRIVVDSLGGKHFTWLCWISNRREVYYNYLSPTGEWGWPGNGTSIGAPGYPQIDVSADCRAVVATYNPRLGAESLFLAVDYYPGFGFWDFFLPPGRLGNDYFLWPYFGIDDIGRVHLVATQGSGFVGSPLAIAYTRSNNGGTTWTALTRVDTVKTISAIVAASPVSRKIAIVYTHPVDTTSQLKNDVYYIESPDGAAWDWAHGKTNVTHYGQGGDSLFAYTDVDAIYDYNDNLHITWNARWVALDTAYDRVFLYHYDVSAGTVTEMTHLDMPETDSCGFGGWNLAINKMSLGVNSSNALYAAYTQFDTSDCSLAGVANGEIYVQSSSNGGATWSLPVDVTNSHTPHCPPGLCSSDVYPSLADIVDRYLHLFYVEDGRYSQDPVSSIPMLYLAYPLPVSNNNDKPTMAHDFALSQNYPNPFNVQTTIRYDLPQPTDVRIEIFDILGRKIETLVSGHQEAGPHSVIWDAREATSGVYYCRLSTAGGSRVKKMILLK